MEPNTHSQRDQQRAITTRLSTLLAPLAIAGILVLALSPSLASATSFQSGDGQTGDATTEGEQAEEDGGAGGTEVDDARLALGSEVYTQICSACHQAGGAGLPGSYPPLIDNPRVQDAEYVRGVINNGLQGEIVVNGETYNGVMPSFSTLADDEVDAVIFYVQSGFQAPAGPLPDTGQTGPVAGTELPGLTNLTWQAGFLIAAFVVLLVIGPRLTSRNDRLGTPWFDATLKTATIVIAAAIAIAYIPNWVLQTDTVSGLPRLAQDLIGVSVWTLGLLACLGGLWYAHRESRI